MNYLHPTDVLMASACNRRWFEAAQHFCGRQLALTFAHCHLSTAEPPLQHFLNPLRAYTKITLSQIDFGSDTAAFWAELCDTVQHLSIRNCDLREKNLKQILMQLTDLRALEIENCRELFMPGRLFEHDQQAVCQACRNIESLALINNRYLSDALFNRFVAIMPRLSHLDLSGCHISFHKGLYKKFYPDHQQEPSESVLTFHYISQFIECEASALKSFNFSCTLIDGEALQTLATLSGLALHRLELRSCDQLTNAGIITLVQLQTQLQHLDLSYSVRLTDAGLMEICRCLPNVRSLRLRRCRALTDSGIVQLQSCRQLEVLDISECESITSRGLIDGVAKYRSEQLRELYLSALNICQLAIVRVAEQFPELRVLDLSFCKNGCTNLAVQWICKHLRWLRTLNLEHCDKIGDAAMTGIDMQAEIDAFENDKYKDVVAAVDQQPANNDDDDAAILEERQQQPPELYKISLRSRAEEDIVNDAKRKKVMLAIYEHKGPITDYSGYSIKSLRGLRVLNVTACNRITDVSLKYSFHLNELKEVRFARCQQITTDGISNLVRHCPSLELVDLSECHNITDKTIEVIAVKLRRLTRLYLERCIQLSDHSLDYMAVNCERLRYLNVRGCRAMCGQPNLRLVNLSTLKYVAMSKPGPYVNSGDDDALGAYPKPPPLPPTAGSW